MINKTTLQKLQAAEQNNKIHKPQKLHKSKSSIYPEKARKSHYSAHIYKKKDGTISTIWYFDIWQVMNDNKSFL